jgi:hypothetical protein
MDPPDDALVTASQKCTTVHVVVCARRTWFSCFLEGGWHGALVVVHFDRANMRRIYTLNTRHRTLRVGVLRGSPAT